MRALVAAAVVLGCGPPARQAPAPATPPATAPLPAIPTVAATPAIVKPAVAHKIPTRSSDVVVAVTGVKVVMNGVEVSGKPMVADLISVFGKPDRTWDQGGANKVHTWDRIGLLVYEPYDGRCISATFPYKPMSQSFDPTTMFSGSISVDGKRFTAATTLATVKSWPGATMPYSQASVVFDKADIHVFTIEEAPPGTIDLVEISFWQRGKRDEDDEPHDEGVRRDRATGLLALDCRAGDARMCTRLALIHQTGTIADKDHARAFTFAKQGCDGGDAFGCTMLGNMYDAGRGTTQSRGNAKTAWKRACTLGDRVGCDRAK